MLVAITLESTLHGTSLTQSMCTCRAIKTTTYFYMFFEPLWHTYPGVQYFRTTPTCRTSAKQHKLLVRCSFIHNTTQKKAQQNWLDSPSTRHIKPNTMYKNDHQNSLKWCQINTTYTWSKFVQTLGDKVDFQGNTSRNEVKTVCFYFVSQNAMISGIVWVFDIKSFSRQALHAS